MHCTVAIGPICLLSRSTCTQSSRATRLATSFGAKWWKIGGEQRARLSAATNEKLQTRGQFWSFASNNSPIGSPENHPLSPNNTRSLMFHTFHISPPLPLFVLLLKNPNNRAGLFPVFSFAILETGGAFFPS